MYFVPKGNRLYRWAVTKSSFMRYLILCGGAAFLCVTWYFFAYTACETHLAKRDQSLSRMRKECSVLPELRAECDTLQAAIDAHTTQLHACSAKQKEQNDSIYILDQAKKNNLTLSSYTVHNKHVKKWYTREDVQCSFVGGLPQITQFLADIKNNDRMIQCKSMKMTRDDDERYALVCDLQVSKVS